MNFSSLHAATRLSYRILLDLFVLITLSEEPQYEAYFNLLALYPSSIQKMKMGS
jgi:hypothetical protein